MTVASPSRELGPAQLHDPGRCRAPLLWLSQGVVLEVLSCASFLSGMSSRRDRQKVFALKTVLKNFQRKLFNNFEISFSSFKNC